MQKVLWRLRWGDVAAEVAGLGESHERVEVRPVDVDLTAGGVDLVADDADIGLEDAVRRRVGDHDRGEPITVLGDLLIEVVEVDRTVAVGRLDDLDVEAGEDGGGGVRPVRRLRDEADGARGSPFSRW